MQVNYFDINIIDTESNTEVVYLEKTAFGGPGLIYNGAENLHQTIMTSELHFSFLVSELHSTKHRHLFTGSEVRYKVELIDSSVYGYPKTIWVGYLLPEQFNEPYKAKDYFIDFIATDGVALLKEKEYAPKVNTTIRDTAAILTIVNECLLQTGLELPIRFAEAIENAVFELDYRDFEVSVLAYQEDEGYLDAFTVLEKALTFLGCKLFQFGGYWYVTALSKQKDLEVAYKEYQFNEFYLTLDYVKDVTITKEIVNAPILEGANVALVPPFKSVTVTWDADLQESVLPADIVSNLSVDDLLGYWEKRGVEPFLLTSYFKDYLLTNEEENVYENYNNGTITPPVDSFDLDNLADGPYLSLKYNGIQSVYGGGVDIDTSVLPNHYITLKKPFYVNGETDQKVKGTLKIDFKTIGYNLFLGTATPATGTATVIGGVKIGSTFKRTLRDYVKFESVGHGLVNGDVISIEDSVDGDTYYTGVFTIKQATTNTFVVERKYNSDYVYSANWVQITDFNTVEQAEEELRNHFSKSGEFTAIDNTGSFPKITSNNHGLELGMCIRIPVKEGYAKREYDGIHFVSKINDNQFTLLTNVVDVSYAGKWEIVPFRNNFIYSIKKSKYPWIDFLESSDIETVVFSNIFDESVRGIYDYDISQNGVTVKGSLTLENVVLDADAWYNIRLHPVGSSDYLGNEVVYTNLEFNLSDQQEITSTIKRDINYTGALLVDTFHNSSKLQNTNRNIYFSDSLITSFVNDLTIFKSFDAAETYFVVDNVLQLKEVILNATDYQRVQLGYQPYVYNATADTLTLIENYIIVRENDAFALYLNDESDSVKINLEDKIVLQFSSMSTEAIASELFKETWCRVGVNEQESWLTCLAKIYHQLYQSTAIKCIGEITSLVGPLDLVNLYYDQENKVCTPTNININLNEGKTNITIVENKTENITDYE